MKKRDLHRAEPRHDTIKSHYIQEHRHDPYKARGKLHEPTICPQCTAVFHEGRWQWMKERPEGAHQQLCPACHRINDNYPAGELTVGGTFLPAHREEIIALARNTEQAEKSEHPLQRIISIDEAAGKIVITTTDIHLPRRIGHAIVAAFKGALKTQYDEEGYFVRISWERQT